MPFFVEPKENRGAAFGKIIPFSDLPVPGLQQEVGAGKPVSITL